MCFHRDNDDNDHGICRVNMARALAQWQRLGASHEATKTLHRAMCDVTHAVLPQWHGRRRKRYILFFHS